MKKFLISTLLFALMVTPALGASTLWEYYNGNLPSISERAVTYAEIGSDVYVGSYGQNVALLSHLETPTLGTAIPDVVATFETSLATKITSTADAMTLVSGTTPDGTTLNGTYGFVIDEGSASEEFVLATCADTACTNMTRGISTVTGTSSVDVLKFSHRRGASVKITNHPALITLIRILNGQGTFPHKIIYDNLSFGAGDSGDVIVDKAYVDAIVNAGAATSSEIVAGITELATRTEMANSTDLGANRPLVLQAKNATSSPTISDNLIVVTESDGNINQNFLDLTENFAFSGDNTLSGENTFSATTTMATTTSPKITLTATSTDWDSVQTKGYIDNLQSQYSAGTKVGNTTATTDTIAHGLNGTPNRIKITAFNESSTYIYTSTGVYDGTSYATISLRGGDTPTLNTSYVSYLASGEGNYMRATASMNNTNIVLTWTENSYNGDFSYLWEAFID